MTRPSRYLATMLIFLGIVATGVILILPALRDAFMSNPVINGVIIGVLFIGIAHSFKTVGTLFTEVGWVEAFRTGRQDKVASTAPKPRLLASAATMIAQRFDRTGHLQLSTTALQTLLDGVATRLDEGRETSRYLVGLLVFLGLLGTFWGLLETVRSVADVIGSLQIGGSEISSAFQDLKDGLKSPLSGMSTAFASSLFGLAGSLVLGFLTLQVGQAQNRFYNEFEEWLSSVTRLTGGGVSTDGEQSVPAYIQALLEQTADSLDSLRRTIQRGEESRAGYDASLSNLNDKLGTLVDTMKTEQELMRKLAESQSELRGALTKMVQGQGGGDDQTRTHVRNIDTHLNRLIEDLHRGRNETVQEIRNEIRLLARTIAAIAESD